MREAPDLIAPLVGYRVFSVADGELVSPFWGEPRQVFVAGANHAVCQRRRETLHNWVMYGSGGLHPDDEPVPSHHCGCGLYAYHNLASAVAACGRGMLVAAVKASGQTEIHRHGFRTQTLEILALASFDDSGDAATIAARYGVPLADLGQLIVYARRGGESVSSELLPEQNWPVLQEDFWARELRLLSVLFGPLAAAAPLMVAPQQRRRRKQILAASLLATIAGAGSFVASALSARSQYDPRRPGDDQHLGR